MSDAEKPVQKVVLVTGPSGAGRSTAIHALEDLGYEAIDNLPLSLIPRLLDGPVLTHPVALGIDVRNREFSATALIEAIDRLTRDPMVDLELLYLDCSVTELIRRFSETRRRHPMGDTPVQAIEAEIDLLAPIRVRADVLIDTSGLTVHDLKAEIAHWFSAGAGQRMAVSVQSFSYKRGVDLMFDVRFLDNPHWVPALRPLDGRDLAVVAHVQADPRFDTWFGKVLDLITFTLPAHLDEGKAHLSIGFGCTGGQHRSVAVAEKMAAALAQAGWPVSIRHRELERRSAASGAASGAASSAESAAPASGAGATLGEQV
ncbi:RNase adapter RapZ [Paracoccus sp. p4-l81]|uniref:RNase adapter RapZ n=1 Tax=Paracoccus sp. p4-l81 TaxID=3342806 RepID=UPI0035BA970F